MNVSSLLAQRCRKVCLVELSAKNSNPTNDPQVTQLACMCVEAMNASVSQFNGFYSAQQALHNSADAACH